MRRVLAAITLIMLGFGSCSDGGFLERPRREPPTVEVLTVAPGSIMRGGDSIPIAIRRLPDTTTDPETPDELLVEVLDHAGVTLAEKHYESVDQADTLPAVALPDLADGLYWIRTTYRDGEKVLASASVPVFIVSGDYRLTGVTSYPASSYPGAEGLLGVGLDVPAESDPFLVIRIDGAVAHAEYLSVSGPTVAVRAPGAPGIYTVWVELYPILPTGTSFNDVPAPLRYDSELVVTRTPAPRATDLGPQASYFALYHFAGLFAESGMRQVWLPNRDLAGRPVGTPELAAVGEVFGYRFTRDSALRLPGAVWPLHEDGLSPASFSFRLLPDALAPSAQLLKVDGALDWLLVIELDEYGRVGVRLHGSPDPVWSGPLLAPHVAADITVSVNPESEATRVAIYLDGQLESTHSLPAIDDQLVRRNTSVQLVEQWSMLEGTSVVGAGFEGVIDEFGVYFRNESNEPSVNTGVFRAGMEALHGNRLVYAEGFEGREVPADIDIEGLAVWENDALALYAGAVRLPDFAFDEEDLVIEFEILLRAAVRVIFSDPDTGSPFGEALLQSSEPAAGVEVRTVRLRHSGTSLLIESGGQWRHLLPAGPEFAGLSVALEGVAEEEDPAARGDEAVADRTADAAGDPEEEDPPVHDPQADRVPLFSLSSVVAWRDRPWVPGTLRQDR